MSTHQVPRKTHTPVTEDFKKKFADAAGSRRPRMIPAKEGRDQERRREKRNQVVGDIFWSYSYCSGSPKERGTIINLSDSGLGIFTERFINPGYRLKIASGGLWDGVRYAIVKWCREDSPGIYRAGLRKVRRK